MAAGKELILGGRRAADEKNFSASTAFDDHKIKFVVKRCRGKNVLDLGCVQHNPRNYNSRYWLHKAIKKVAASVVGIDLYEIGVHYLKERGFDVIVADAQCFNLGRIFDVIVAGDVVEHLDNFDGFFNSCKRHMFRNSKLLISTPNAWYWRNIVKVIIFRKVIRNNPEHTCWLCPITLRQLANRYGFDFGEVMFGSSYVKDKLMPLPSGIKHTSFHAELFLK